MGRRGLRVHVNTLDLRQGLAVSITHAMVYDGAMNTTHASQEGLVARFAAAARGVEERSAGQLYVACWTGRMRVLAPVTREGGLGGPRYTETAVEAEFRLSCPAHPRRRKLTTWY